MNKNAYILPIPSLLLLLFLSITTANTQDLCSHKVFHLDGAKQIGNTNVTVSAFGLANSLSDYCGNVEPYWIGENMPPPAPTEGSYTFDFSPPAQDVTLAFAALDNNITGTEEVSIYLNGSPYFIPSVGSPHSCEPLAMLTPLGTLIGCPGCDDGSGCEGIHINGPISSITVTNTILLGGPNGVLFSLEFQESCCLTDAGKLPLIGPLHFCIDAEASVPPSTKTYLGAHDILNYILFADPSDTLGSMIALSTTPKFSFDPATMVAGETYYIAAVAGINLNGIVNLNSPCLDFSNAIEVIWDEKPKVSFEIPNYELCKGSCAKVKVTFTGIPPFTLTVNNDSLGSFTETFQSHTGVFEICLPPGAATGYYLFEAISLTDKYCNCPCSDLGSFEFYLVPLPTVTLSYVDHLCPGQPSTTITVNQVFDEYLWSNAAFHRTIHVTAGSYSVTVTDQFGCKNTVSAVITQAAAPDISITTNPYLCDGLLSLQADTGLVAYSWSTGSHFSSITVDSNSTYTVTATNAFGCTGTASTQSFVPPVIFLNIEGTQVVCPGASATLTASSGFSEYKWSDGSNTPTLVTDTEGTYTVTVIDAVGCSLSASRTIAHYPTPTPQFSPPPPVCQGQSTLISLSNGPFYSYIWTDSSTTAAITVNTANMYSVTVTDDKGCTGTASIDVTIYPNPAPPAITQTAYACKGFQILVAELGFAQYSWSNAVSTLGIQVDLPGEYTVTVTDWQGCTNSASKQVTIPTTPVVHLSGQANICTGDTATLTATNGFSQYNWNIAAAQTSIRVVAAGDYSLTVTDDLGCTATDSIYITVHEKPQPYISGPSGFCPSDSITLGVPNIYAAYQWSNAAHSAEITASSTGAYTITVTDLFGCTGQSEHLLVQWPAPEPAILALPYTCNGQLALDGGAGFQAYNWSNGGSNATITVSNEGITTLTVTDSNGCTGSASFDVQLPAVPVVTIEGPVAVCGGDTAMLTATSGFMHYNWNIAATQTSIQAVAAGDYSLTVTDDLGCTAVDSFTLILHEKPQPYISGPSGFCPLDSIILGVSGIYAAYQWSNAAHSAEITASSNGAYTITVTDLYGCTGQSEHLLVQWPAPEPDILALPYTCNGQLSLDGGAGFKAYNWSNGDLNATINVSTEGITTLTVTDTNGCTGSASFDVHIPVIPVVTIEGPEAICAGDTAMLTATGGSLSYLWSTGVMNPQIHVSAPGLYQVTATDAYGCTAIDQITLNIHPLPSIEIMGNNSICKGATVQLNATPGFIQYQWNNGSTTDTIYTNQVGYYEVTVLDAFGCAGSANVTLTASNDLSPIIIQQAYQCNNQLTLDVGTGFDFYNWSTGSNTSTAVVFQNGTYTITVTNANGCSGTASIPVDIAPLPIPEIIGSVEICTGGSSTFSISNPSEYTGIMWTNGYTGDSILINAPGEIGVTVTDSNGCTGTASTTLTVSNNLHPAININPYQCDHQLELHTGIGYNTYTWSNGADTPTIQVNTEGNYTVTVTNNSGCSGTASISIQIPLQQTVAIQCPKTEICPGTTTALSATPGWSAYIWDSGETDSTITVGQEGVYRVVVRDQNGCTASDEFTITFSEIPQIDIVGNTSLNCENTFVILSVISIANGDKLLYNWSTGDTTPTVTLSNAGEFQVTVTNLAGCSSVDTIQVFQSGIYNFFADTIEFQPGQLISLYPLIGFNANSFQWSPAGILSCSDCPKPNARPTETVIVQFLAQTGLNCISEGFYLLRPKERPGIYVPNVIYPGSNQNFAFTIYGNQLLRQINYIRVYDRWGSLIQELHEIAPGDPQVGWDGTFRGQVVSAGVYVYVAEILLADGTTEVLSGDVTVIRMR